MTYRTLVGLSFLGILLLVLGFLFLPWYVAPIGAGNNLLRGPAGWTLATVPAIATPDFLGWVFTLPFWILALLILFELGSAIFALQRDRSVQIGRVYKVSGQIGLALAAVILILTLIGLVPGLGWRGVLLTFGGIGFWCCLLGFVIIRQAGVSLQRR
jgi:hypothetical protein